MYLFKTFYSFRTYFFPIKCLSNILLTYFFLSAFFLSFLLTLSFLTFFFIPFPLFKLIFWEIFLKIIFSVNALVYPTFPHVRHYSVCFWQSWEKRTLYRENTFIPFICFGKTGRGKGYTCPSCVIELWYYYIYSILRSYSIHTCYFIWNKILRNFIFSFLCLNMPSFRGVVS